MTTLSDAVADDERINAFAALTPMQQLVLEVLASRYRLGHEMWTFTSSAALTRALRALEELDYVNAHSGVVQGTVRVSLTWAGRELILDPHYVAPILQPEE